MPDPRLVRLAELDERGLRSLAELHESVMRTLLSDLGLPFVLKYYRIAKTDSSVLGFCLTASDGELVGWVIGSPDPGELFSQLRSPVGWFAIEMLRLAVTRPAALWALAASALAPSARLDIASGIELTYIGVARRARGSGLGESLLRAFIDASRERGYRAIELSVESANSAAAGLYAKFGFGITRTFREGRFDRRRMALML